MRSRTEKLSRKEFLAVRDFLIARIALENGQRSGPMETATLRDFQRIQKKDDKYIMYMSRHKGSKSGPVPLTMTENLKSSFECFITDIRGGFVKEGQDAIFVKDTGTAFNGNIGKRIQKWWEKATRKKNVTSTRLRQMHASQLYNVDDSKKRSAHRLMCHTGQTAKTYYIITPLEMWLSKVTMSLQQTST